MNYERVWRTSKKSVKGNGRNATGVGVGDLRAAVHPLRMAVRSQRAAYAIYFGYCKIFGRFHRLFVWLKGRIKPKKTGGGAFSSSAAFIISCVA